MARCFTGWTIHDPYRYGEFDFNPSMHDRGEKVVLGRTIPAHGGEHDGTIVIGILARHPSTARFISRKLAQRFVADRPPPRLVRRMAATFTDTGGDLRAVLDTLFSSREFLSHGAWRSKTKSPLEMVISALRAVDAEIADAAPIARRLEDLGQPLYGKREPTGYPNTGEAWVSSLDLLGRIQFATDLMAGRIEGVVPDTNAVPAEGAARWAALLGGPPSAGAAAESATGDLSPAEAIAALIASPEFQRR